jgi:Protein tyrosine phosphatase-like protein, PTPLA
LGKLFKIVVFNFAELRNVENNHLFCDDTLRPALAMALTLSFIEVVNALVGVTRSKPHLTLFFSLVRTGVSYWIAPLLPHCGVWQTVMTITAWSFGDTIRFACFCLDSLVPGGLRLARAVRYTVAPLLFLVGAAGEMLMVIAAARDGRTLLFVMVAIWPFGFYALMNQLIKQRQKFFATSCTSAPKMKATKVKAV